MNEFVNIENNMMNVLINATVSASQLSALAFSPRAFAQIRHNDLIIKIGSRNRIRTDTPLQATHFKCVVSRQFHHTAISKLVVRVGLEPTTLSGAVFETAVYTIPPPGQK